VCWRTAAFAVGMDAVNAGEAVLAAWQSANQARSAAHPPSRPWRVGRASGALSRSKGSPTQPSNVSTSPVSPANPRCRTTPTTDSRTGACTASPSSRFASRRGCAAAAQPRRAEPQTAGGSGLWSVPNGRANPSTQRHWAAAASASVRAVVSQLCHGMTERRIRSARRAEPAAVSRASRALPAAGHAARPVGRKAMRPTRPVRARVPACTAHRTGPRRNAAVVSHDRTLGPRLPSAVPPSEYLEYPRRCAFRPPSRPVSTWSTFVGAPSVRHHSHQP